MNRLITLYILILIITFIQNYWLQGFTALLSIFSIFLLILFSQDKRWFENELYNKKGLKKVFLSILISLLALFLLQTLWNLTPITASKGLLKIQLKDWDSLIILSLNIFFFCLIEELIFRGYFQEEIKKMSQVLPKPLSIFYQLLIPAILFSLMHFFKMGFACLIILIPGIIFGALKYYSGNIYAAVISHLIFNFYYESLALPKPF